MHNLKALFAVVSCLAAVPLAAGDPVTSRLPQTPLSDAASPFTDLSQLARAAVTHLGRPQAWGVNDEVSRGFGESVYPTAAPAIVVVQTYYGHGTGFFIREDGWLLTNRHVVQDADYDGAQGGQLVYINIGTLDDEGWMHVIDRQLPALVYKTDQRQDLALVKLLEMPAGVEKLPVIPFAAETPRPGADCVAIGHPAAGTLWTLRTGELAGTGMFPDDQMDQVIYMLGIASGDRNHFVQTLRNDPQRKRVLLSTCGLNPGDSGGPLLNEKGELVGVSYAIPTIDLEAGVDRGKFSFHIHLKEVDEFLSLWPDTPIIEAPSPVAAGKFFELRDTDKDGHFDTLLISNAQGQPPIGMLLDLDGDSYGGKSVTELEKSGEAVNERGFEYEFALSGFPHSRVSFDTDNDGTMDLVFSDEDHDQDPEVQMALVDGEWTINPISGDPMAPRHFRDPKLQKRFKVLNTGK